MKPLLKILLPLFIIGVAIWVGKFLVSLKKEPESRQPRKVMPVVNIITVSPKDHRPPISSFGTVQSYFQTQLVPQVSGAIIEISPKFKVGEMVKKDEVLARIDGTDFQSALANEQANLALHQRTLAEEEILAKQAVEDWRASGRKVATASEFVLRKPQLNTAKANITSAEAAIEKALMDIERTQIRVPYDAVVTARSASLGSFANIQSSLGTLIATERAEVRLPLTAEQLDRVGISELGDGDKNVVKLINPNNTAQSWSARLVRMEPTVDIQNQVSYVIAEIDSPYENTEAPLSIGTFVNALIPSKAIGDTYRVPEEVLVNDQYIWALDEKDQLLRVAVTREQSYEGEVYLRVKENSEQGALRIVSRPLSNFGVGDEVKPNEPENSKNSQN